MKMISLQDNALFLQNWRERMRLPSLASAVILLIIIIVLIYMNAYLNPTYVYSYDYNQMNCQPETRYNHGSNCVPTQHQEILPWIKKFFLDLCSLQGIIILLIATGSAYRMAARERVSGTLDFHRSSPTPPGNQTLGLLLGATSLEWCIFAGIAFIELFLVLTTSINFSTFLNFNFALILCALLYHSLAALLGIIHQPHKSKLTSIPMIFGIYIIIMLLSYPALSTLYHLSWQPAYEQLYSDVQGKLFTHRSYYSYDNQERVKLLYNFLGFNLPSLFLQIMVQVPFLGVVFVAILRKISKPEHPIVSKPILLLTIFYILFLFCGSVFPIITAGEGKGWYSWGEEMVFYCLIALIMCLGIIGAWIITPSRLQYIKGLRRCKKLGLKKIDSGDDQASSTVWLFGFSIVTIIIFSFFVYLYKISFTAYLISIVFMLSSPIFFACFLEYFHLSRHHNKIIIFWTILIILWILIPTLGTILNSVTHSDILQQYFSAFTPWGGISPIVDLITKTPTVHLYEKIRIILSINILLAVIAGIFAKKVRAELQKETLENS